MNEKNDGPSVIHKRSDETIILNVTEETIAEALPPTVSIEDRKTIAEQTFDIIKQQKEAFEEENRKREKEHEEVVKAFGKERKAREKEHKEAVKWRRISIAVTVFFGSISIYLGYLLY